MIHFIFGIHNHQPAGNFGYVIEEAFEKAYIPFIETLKRHPGIRVAVHFSGILYDWMEEFKPEYEAALKSMIKAGQVEIIGGGYYEPILAVLPHRDQRGQLSFMNGRINEKFGKTPKGVWLAERVWEPQLVGALSESGAEYTLLDDIHFLSSGFFPEELSGYFITEFEGSAVKVFPIDQKLRYHIPFSDPEKVIEYLRVLNENSSGGAVRVMADDGEKFGLWPGTHELVYGRKWLDRFFSLLEENQSWIKVSTFSEYMAGFGPKGLAYLPTGSYHELSQWALGAEAGAQFIRIWEQSAEENRKFMRGGYFRNFFSKYPESNKIYRKMLRVSDKINDIAPDEKAKKDALVPLWKGQCNCGYWHGVFGGLYLPHIRMEIYRNLLSAESIADAACGLGGKFEVSQADWDADGSPEIFIESAKADWYMSPAKGGGLWEWDFKPAKINWISVVSRRREAYHGEVRSAVVSGGNSVPGVLRAKEEGLADKIFYDWHLRMCLLDHFMHPNTRRGDFARAQYGEQGDFVMGEYGAEVKPGGSGERQIILSRRGTVWCGGAAVPATVRKNLRLNENGSWSAEYCVSNNGDQPADIWFGPELVFSFSKESICPEIEEENVSEKNFNDDVYGKLRIGFSRPMDIWTVSLKTVSMSEGGFESTYQGSVILCHTKTRLLPGASLEFGINITANV